MTILLTLAALFLVLIALVLVKGRRIAPGHFELSGRIQLSLPKMLILIFTICLLVALLAHLP